MLDALIFEPATPPAYVREAKRKRSRSNGTNSQGNGRKSKVNTALFIGAIVVLTDHEGTEYDCQIFAFEDGTWLCQPVSH